jgi:hypothetical protein
MPQRPLGHQLGRDPRLPFPQILVRAPSPSRRRPAARARARTGTRRPRPPTTPPLPTFTPRATKARLDRRLFHPLPLRPRRRRVATIVPPLLFLFPLPLAPIPRRRRGDVSRIHPAASTTTTSTSISRAVVLLPPALRPRPRLWRRRPAPWRGTESSTPSPRHAVEAIQTRLPSHQSRRRRGARNGRRRRRRRMRRRV